MLQSSQWRFIDVGKWITHLCPAASARFLNIGSSQNSLVLQHSTSHSSNLTPGIKPVQWLWSPQQAVDPLVIHHKSHKAHLHFQSCSFATSSTGRSSTESIRQQLIQEMLDRDSRVLGLNELLRHFARKHVIVMTHSELMELREVLLCNDTNLWKWIEDGHTTPDFLLDNSSFGLLQQFARFWFDINSAEYK